jgi:hypothetical protein
MPWGRGRREGGKEGSEFPIHLFESRAGREQDVQRRIGDRRTDTGRIPYGYRVTCPVQASAVGLPVPFPSAVSAGVVQAGRPLPPGRVLKPLKALKALKALKPWR